MSRMPYPRYSRGGSNRRDDYCRGGMPSGSGGGMQMNPWQSSGGPGGLLPTPGGGGGGPGNLSLAGNLLGSLLNPGDLASNLAGQLAMVQALNKSSMPMGMSPSGMGGGPFMGGGNMRGDVRGSRRGSSPPPRRGYNRRSRSRSRSPRRDSRPYKRSRDDPTVERPQFEIYIGNYPVKFRESDLRSLFEEHEIEVKTIRMKNDGIKVFAFAETISRAEIDRAIKSMDSKEIEGRRLRVRGTGDKDKDIRPLLQNKKRDLTVLDVKRHLAFAFNEFLGREIREEGQSEEKVEKMKQTQSLIKEVFSLPEDDSLVVNRSLELIFLQCNRREIKLPEETKEDRKRTNIETKKSEDEDSVKLKDKEETSKDQEEEKEEESGNGNEDDGNWKRRKVSNKDSEDFLESELIADFADGEEEVVKEADEGTAVDVDITEQDEIEEISTAIEVDGNREEVTAAKSSDGKEGEDDEGVDAEPEEVELEAETVPAPAVTGARGRGQGGRARSGRGRRT